MCIPSGAWVIIIIQISRGNRIEKVVGRLESLRFQIFLLLLIFGIVPGFFLRAGLLSAYEHRAVEVQTSDITGQAQLLATQIASSNYLSDQSEENILSS